MLLKYCKYTLKYCKSTEKYCKYTKNTVNILLKIIVNIHTQNTVNIPQKNNNRKYILKNTVNIL